MGLLDRASRGFNRATEETVRVVDYDVVQDEEPKLTEAKAKKPQREKRKFSLGASSKAFLAKKDTQDDLPAIDASELPEVSPAEEDDNELLALATGDAIFDSSPVTPRAQNTAFEINDDEPNFYDEKQKLWEKDQKTRGGVIDDLLPEDGAIQDVLDVLKIPATFVIREDVLMPQDFNEIDFDIQVPQGYDIGQVQFFVEKAETSVKELVNLLQLRNEHVAKLATTIDRLQVDANNLKYDNQIAAGIGIIPTSDSVDIENENMELKVELQKLKDAQKTTINSQERKLYEEMRNELSRKVRENEALEEKNYELRTLVAQLEENAEDMLTEGAPDEAHEAAEIIFQNLDDDDELPDLSSSMPSLPEVLIDEEQSFESPAKHLPKASAFAGDEDDVDDLLNSLETPEPQQTFASNTLEDDDEDDELDQLMREWKN